MLASWPVLTRILHLLITNQWLFDGRRAFFCERSNSAILKPFRSPEQDGLDRNLVCEDRNPMCGDRNPVCGLEKRRPETTVFPARKRSPDRHRACEPPFLYRKRLGTGLFDGSAPRTERPESCVRASVSSWAQAHRDPLERSCGGRSDLVLLYSGLCRGIAANENCGDSVSIRPRLDPLRHPKIAAIRPRLIGIQCPGAFSLSPRRPTTVASAVALLSAFLVQRREGELC